MEHLSTPNDPVYPSLDIPYLGATYDPERCIHSDSDLCDTCAQQDLRGWNGFPARRGWSRDPILRGDSAYISQQAEVEGGAEGITAFLQAWLYFGLLSEFFDGDVKTSEFLRTADDGSLLLDTSTLPKRINQWSEDVKSWPEERKTDYTTHVDDIFYWTSYFLISYTGDSGYWHPGSPLSEEISLSISVLATTLVNAKAFVLGGKSFSFGPLFPMLNQRLRDAFWCPRDIYRLIPSHWYFASLMRPWRLGISHDSCTEDSCALADVDEDNYVVVHTEEGCDCLHVSVDVDEVVAKIENGVIPLHSFSLQGKDLMVLDQTIHDESAYLAISHVWADGMGNPRANSLPTCQIHKIQTLANHLREEPALTSNLPIWIDTLSVPITQDGKARRKAIARMNSIYKNASVTLVLDAELMKQSMNADAVELFMRIVHSRWSHRLWTFQEASAAKYLVFRFSDGFVEFELLKDAMVAYLAANNMCDAVGIDLYRWAFTLASTSDPSENLLRAFENASGRSTSRESDELICVAALAGFNREQMETLLQSEPETRTKTFVQLLGRIPKNLIFVHQPTLPDKGFGWCPKRLIQAWKSIHVAFSDCEFFQLTPEGLRGQSAGLRFQIAASKARFPLRAPFFIKDVVKRTWFFFLPQEEERPDFKANIQERAFYDMSLIIGQTTTMLDQLCLLVDIIKNEDGVLFVKRRCACRMFTVEQHMWARYNADTEALRGLPLRPEQKWCIE